MQSNKLLQKGFGIIEVLVSAVLLMIVAGSVIGLGRMALKNNVLSTQRTQAFNLARDQVEQIINQRNDNWVSSGSADWTKTNIPSTTTLLPYSPTDIITSKDNTIYTTKIIYDKLSSASMNQIDGWFVNPSINIDQKNILSVKVIVSWQYGGTTYSVNDSIMLTNWKPQL